MRRLTLGSIGPVVLLLFGAEVLAQEVEIVHMNVGQGDATLIMGPADGSGNRVSVLVDAGDMSGPDGGTIVRGILADQGLSSIDFFIATHYDADHVGGVARGGSHGTSFVLGEDGVPGSPGDDDSDGVVDWSTPFFIPDPDELGIGDDIQVGTFVDRGDTPRPSTQVYKKYVGVANNLGTRKSLANQADVNSFGIDLGGGAGMIALTANGFVRNRETKVPKVTSENERSLCFLLQFGGFDYLLGGDVTGRKSGGEDARIEEAIAAFIEANDVEIDVLHVNHHGANNASEKGFLEMASPEVAIISLGNGNTHDHPALKTLKRLAAADVDRIFQTEWGTTKDGVLSNMTIPLEVRARQSIVQGHIVLTTDGQSYRISSAQEFTVDE